MIELYFSCFLVHSQYNVIMIVYIGEDSISWYNLWSDPLCIIDQIK